MVVMVAVGQPEPEELKWGASSEMVWPASARRGVTALGGTWFLWGRDNDASGWTMQLVRNGKLAVTPLPDDQQVCLGEPCNGHPSIPR